MSTDSSKGGASLDFKIIARIIRLARPHGWLLVFAVLLTMLLTILAPLRPMLVQYTIDEHIASKNSEGILLFTFYLLLHIIVHSLTLFGHTYITNLLGQ